MYTIKTDEKVYVLESTTVRYHMMGYLWHIN